MVIQPLSPSPFLPPIFIVCIFYFVTSSRSFNFFCLRSPKIQLPSSCTFKCSPRYQFFYRLSITGAISGMRYTHHDKGRCVFSPYPNHKNRQAVYLTLLASYTTSNSLPIVLPMHFYIYFFLKINISFYLFLFGETSWSSSWLNPTEPFLRSLSHSYTFFSSHLPSYFSPGPAAVLSLHRPTYLVSCTYTTP